jgi:hypothetical protein
VRVNPATTRFSGRKTRFVSIMTMLACCLVLLPLHLLAQDNPARDGQWGQLYFHDTERNTFRVVVWRYNAQWWSDQDQALGVYAPNLVWRRVYGVHAALLPWVGEAPPDRHGWVLLWGYGAANNDLTRMHRQDAEPYYFGPRFFGPREGCPLTSADHYLNTVALTPVLFWYPIAPPMCPINGRAVAYGYVRYLFDTDPWSASSPSWPVYNLFCAGHAFLPDGRLFIAGGDTNFYFNQRRTDREDSKHAGLGLFTVLQNQLFQRGGAAAELGLPDQRGTGNRLWRVYEPANRSEDVPPEPRWYPSVVALPDGRMLIVGGIRYAKDQARCDERDGHSWYHELFDPCTGRYVRGGVVPYGREGTDLSGTYPWLHLVSFWDGRLVRERVVSTGPSNRNYALPPPFEVPDPDPRDWPRSYPWRSLPHRSFSRYGGTSVLLPNPVLNPRNARQQVLNQVMVLGGGYTQHPDDVRYHNAHQSTEIMTFSPGTDPSRDTAMEVVAGPNLLFRRADLNAVLLPTGQILVVGGISGTFDPDAGERAWVRRWLYPSQLVLATELLTYREGRWQVERVADAPAEEADEVDDDPRRPTQPKVPNGARVYHSTALLLPDGHVLAAGSATGAYYQSGSEYREMGFDNYVPTIYSPPYLFKSDGTPRSDADRPQIVRVSRTELNYGEQFTVAYQLASDRAGIQSIVLVRPGSVTHSVNFEQRLVRLHYLLATTDQEDQGIASVVAPWHPAIAPPGWYMLFLVDANGVPSKAAWVKLKHACTMLASSIEPQLEGVEQISPEQAEAIENEPITLAFRNATTGTTIATYTLPMARPDPQGRVALQVWTDLPADWYEVYVHPYRSWLGQRVLVNWQPGGRLVVPLRNGDVVKDNQVDYADLVFVLEMQGATGLSEADVNGDGVVNEEDAAIVATNVGQQGDE